MSVGVWLGITALFTLCARVIYVLVRNRAFDFYPDLNFWSVVIVLFAAAGVLILRQFRLVRGPGLLAGCAVIWIIAMGLIQGVVACYSGDCI
jgi:hypothetical protein